MGVSIFPSTILGGYSIICDACGVKMCFDISEDDYNRDKRAYDNYLCPECQEYYARTKRK